MLSQIIRLLQRILPLLGSMVAIRVLILFSRPNLRRRTTVFHELGVIALWLYLAAVCMVTLEVRRILRLDFHPGINYNMVPLDGILSVLNEGDGAITSLNILGNILLFMPLGLLIPLLWKRCGTMIVPLGFALSVLIEATQFYTGRIADVDDVILNTFGAFAGYFLSGMVRFTLPGLARAFRLRDTARPPINRRRQRHPVESKPAWSTSNRRAW